MEGYFSALLLCLASPFLMLGFLIMWYMQLCVFQYWIESHNVNWRLVYYRGCTNMTLCIHQRSCVIDFCSEVLGFVSLFLWFINYHCICHWFVDHHNLAVYKEFQCIPVLLLVCDWDDLSIVTFSMTTTVLVLA